MNMAKTHIKKFSEIDLTNRGAAAASKWVEDPEGTFTATAGAEVFIEKVTGTTQSHSGAGCPAGTKLVVSEATGMVTISKP